MQSWVFIYLFIWNPICLCQKLSSKSASLYEGNCFLLTDDLSIAVSFPAYQSSQSDLLQQVHFWVALWHIKTLFGIHTVLLYCLQASSELFMEVAGDMTFSFAQKLYFILWWNFMWKLFGGFMSFLHLFDRFYGSSPLFPILLPLNPVSENYYWMQCGLTLVDEFSIYITIFEWLQVRL